MSVLDYAILRNNKRAVKVLNDLGIEKNYVI